MKTPTNQGASKNAAAMRSENILATEVLCRDEFALGENIMSKRLLVALLGAAFTCATLSAQELPLIHQPTLTPQNSGTTNGLIAVSPVNPRVVWASGRNGTFTVTTDGGKLGPQAWSRAPKPAVPRRASFQREGRVPDSIGDNPTDFHVYKTLDGGATWTIRSRIRFPLVSTMVLRFGRRNAAFCTAIINGVFPDFRTPDGMTWQDINNNMTSGATR